MKETVQDNKQKRQAEFLKAHTLSEDDLRKLFEGKFARAKAYAEALKKREILSERR